MGSSSPPLLLPSFHPPSLSSFYTTPSHSSSTPPTFEVSTFLSSTWSFFASCVEQIEYEATRQRGRKKKKVQRAPERKCDRDREKGKTLGEKRWKEKTEKGFPFCSFPTWQNAPLYPGEGHGLWWRISYGQRCFKWTLAVCKITCWKGQKLQALISSTQYIHYSLFSQVVCLE